MPTGITLFPTADTPNVVDDLIVQAQNAHAAGVRQIWLGQQFDTDAISLAGLIGHAVPGLGVGTSVVPINPRHPLTLASMAQTAQAAAHGNFSLGVGLGAHAPERQAYGIASTHTIQRLREHLTVLRAVIDTGAVDFHGTEHTAAPQMPVTVAGGAPFPVYVAALGPRALQVTGELADGTLPFLAGPRTIEQFIAPTLAQAAADAGRRPPRIIAQVPVIVSADTDRARDIAATQLAFYDTIPSYQRIIAREGATAAAELAVIGTAETIARTLHTYRQAGATDLSLTAIDRTNPATLHEIWNIAANI